MKKLISTIVFLLFSAGFLGAQNSLENFIFDHHQQRFREAQPETAYRGIQGKPYYTENFITSTIYFADRDSVTVPLRYDLYKDEIEFRQNDKIIWLIKKDVRAIAHGDEKIVCRSLNDEKRRSYFFMVVGGNYSLLRKEKVDLLSAEPLKGYAESKPSRFELQEDFYIQINDRPPVVVHAKRDLKKLVSGNIAALNFLKKEKIKAGREDDLVKFVEFLNSQREK